MRLVSLVIAICLCAVPRVFAQSEDWLVLPTPADSDGSWIAPTVGAIGRELRKQGIGVWSSQRAIDAFEARGSAPPAELTPEMVDRWARLSKEVILPVAFGDYPQALSQLRDLQIIADATLETLNRDPDRAQVVLDNCLYMVRALLGTGDDTGASKQVERCVSTAPGTEPTPRMHPPNVTEMFRQASTPAPGRAGSLLIESEPRDCAVRINGVPAGNTPLERTGLHPGDYRVQVECDRSVPGRVHRVRVAPGGNSLFVMDRFEQALRTEPVLHLLYDEPATAEERTRDAREFNRILPAAAVVLVSTPNAETRELRLLRGAQRDGVFVRILADEGPSESLTHDAVATLLAGECKDLTGPEPVNLDCKSGESKVAVPSRPPRDVRKVRPPRAQFVSGLTLASIGGASLLAGYGLLGARAGAGRDWVNEPTNLDSFGRWSNLRTPIIALGAAGGALVTTAMPLVLPYRAKTPWWAWLSGGLGVGLAVGAIVSGVGAGAEPPEGCDSNAIANAQPCVDRAKRVDLSILLASSAAPLITMPLVYLLRRDDKRTAARLSPGVRVGRTGASVSVRGTF